jgi:outer membrane protein assembly factor BamB
VVADGAGVIHLLDAATGERRWRTELTDPSRSVAVADDSLVIAHGERVTALDRSGAERWSTPLADRAVAPTIADGAVLLGAGRDVHALSLANGSQRWRVSTRERTYTDVILAGISSPPVAVAGAELVATNAGDVYALADT